MQYEVLQKLTELRQLLDEWYQLTTRSRIESAMYLEADNMINEIKGLYMNEKIKEVET